MKFQRHIKTKRPWPKGFSSSFENYGNKDPACFQLGGGEIDFELHDKDFPERFSMQGRIKPVLFQPQESIYAILWTKDKKWDPYKLYQNHKLMEKHSQLEAMEVHFERFLTPSLPENFINLSKVIFCKNFIVQKDGPCTLKQEIYQGKYILNPPGIGGKQPLWAYGGYYQSGCALHEIEQIVFTLTKEQSQTIIHPSRISNWNTKDHEIELINPLTLQQKLSLQGNFEQGHSILKILGGYTETGEEIFITYRSYAVHQKDRLSDLLEIEFEKEKVCGYE